MKEVYIINGTGCIVCVALSFLHSCQIAKRRKWQPQQWQPESLAALLCNEFGRADVVV